MATKSKYTEDWIPVRGITGGAIILNNQEKVTGNKILPRNIVVADRPVDISVYLSQLQLLYNQAQTPAIRKLVSEDIDKANAFINNNVVDTEYFILFKEKDPEMIQKKIRSLINNLASTGLSAQQVTNEDLRVILDNFLNGGKTMEYETVVVRNE